MDVLNKKRDHRNDVNHFKSFIHFIQESISHQNGVDYAVRVGCNFDTLHAVPAFNSVRNILSLHWKILGSPKIICEYITEAVRGMYCCFKNYL